MTNDLPEPSQNLLAVDLKAREQARRRGLWGSKTEESAALLDLIKRLDSENPIGRAAGWSVNQVRDRVSPAQERHVKPEEIPEPWRERFLQASRGSTISADGHPIDDWHYFLQLWDKEIGGDEEDDPFAAPNFGEHLPTAERELLILLCEKRDEVAAFLFPDYGSSRDRSRLDDALERLLEMIQYDKRES